MKHLTRKLMSLLLAMALVCTMVPAAMAASSTHNIALSTDAEDYFTFDEEDEDGYSVYDEIVDALGDDYEDYDYLYVKFRDSDSDSELCVDEDSRYYEDIDDEIDLEDLDEIYVDIARDDDKWTGSYRVYGIYDEDDDDDEELLLTGSITISFDGAGYGDEDIELTWADDDDYYFSDDDTEEGDSVYDAIDYALNSLDEDEWDGTWADLSFDFDADRDSDEVADLEYDEDEEEWYLSINDAGTWTGSWTAYEDKDKDGICDTDEDVLSGTLSIEITAGSGIDILYTASAGEDVALDIDTFEEFWSEYTSGRGTLKSVTFDSVTGVAGTLCYQHADSEKRHNDAEEETFYVEPSKRQNELDDLTFVPTEPRRGDYPTGSVTIRFTAEGTVRSNRSDEASGSITILYTDGDVDPIEYAITGSHTMLNGKDFDAVYRDATNSSSKNPSYTIVFLEVPTSGTLYANTSVDRKGKLTGTELDEDNIASKSFSNKGTGSSSINKVAYEPGRLGAAESVKYAVYSGSSLKYIGVLTFGLSVPEVTYSCTTGSVKFRSADFFTGTSLLLDNYITFGTPTKGALYKNYNGISGTRVTSFDRFSYLAYSGVENIADVTYVPADGFSGKVEIPFTSVNANGNKTSGTVTINVTAVARKTFTDVPATYWAYSYITRLAGAGIVNGTSATTFSPTANVKYGEALKMILTAAGYPKQAEGAGNNWAAPYLTLAQKNGIVSGTVNLTAAITRTDMAAIAAKAMGLSKASSINTGIVGPTDSTDGYVYALYNAGILTGDNSSGRNRFNGSQNFTRAGQAAVVCRILDYMSK